MATSPNSILRRGVWLILLLLAVIAALWLSETRVGRGVLVIVVFATVVGGAIGWLSARGSRLSGSGRDPMDIGDAGSASRHDKGPGF